MYWKHKHSTIQGKPIIEYKYFDLVPCLGTYKYNIVLRKSEPVTVYDMRIATYLATSEEEFLEFYNKNKRL